MHELSSIRLYTYPKERGEPSISVHCQILETFLRVCRHRNYQINFAQDHPRHHRPVGSHRHIIQFLAERESIFDLDARLTATQRADSRAWEIYLLEGPFHAAVTRTRLEYPENYAKLKEDIRLAVGREFPSFAQPFVDFLPLARAARNSFKGPQTSQTPGALNLIRLTKASSRSSRKETENIIQESIANLAERLNTSEDTFFFHGSKPSTIDCTIYGFLVHALRMRSNPELNQAILSNEVLCNYIRWSTTFWFPEYEVILRMVTRKAVILDSTSISPYQI